VTYNHQQQVGRIKPELPSFDAAPGSASVSVQLRAFIYDAALGVDLNEIFLYFRVF
jgi:hypothetical protein